MMQRFMTASFDKKIRRVGPGIRRMRLPVFRPSLWIAGLIDTTPVDFRTVDLIPCEIDGEQRWAVYDEETEVLYIGDVVEG